MAQIALTFDLCVWDVKSLTLSADTREESKSNSKEIALNGAPTREGEYALAATG